MAIITRQDPSAKVIVTIDDSSILSNLSICSTFDFHAVRITPARPLHETRAPPSPSQPAPLNLACFEISQRLSTTDSEAPNILRRPAADCRRLDTTTSSFRLCLSYYPCTNISSLQIPESIDINFNNIYHSPLTLLRMRRDHQVYHHEHPLPPSLIPTYSLPRNARHQGSTSPLPWHRCRLTFVPARLCLAH